jgi:hypothetical protein
MSLSGQQRQQLQSALIDAFPNMASLEQMLAFGLEKNLRAIAGEGSLQEIVFKLIQTADSQGWLLELVRAARQLNPGNQVLFKIAIELLPVNDGLLTERNIDYTRLRNLLAMELWQEANIETYSVMLQVVGRNADDWIGDEELLNFPCIDLRTIDNLWGKYSNKHFGFTVQKDILLSCFNPDGSYDSAVFEKFCGYVGWTVEGRRIFDKEVLFNTNAPRGHLPTLAAGWTARGVARLGDFFLSWLPPPPSLFASPGFFLMSRLLNCGIGNGQ